MINIALVGDIMFGRSFRRKAKDFQPICPRVLQFLQQATIKAGNLETTITNETFGEPGKIFHYRMKPTHIHWLRDFNYLSIANNHILDYGLSGMKNTITNLDNAEIIHTGAGMSIIEAMQMKALVTEIQGVRITVGFISATDHYARWAASSERYGVNYLDMKQLKNQKKYLQYVREQAKNVDILIVYLHWGPNYVAIIPSWMKKFGRKLIDNGATIIAGTSPHHVLPVEKYKGGIIFYSLGDFIDDYAIDPIYRNDIGMIAMVSVTQRGIVDNIKILPTIIQNLRVHLL